jgi:hypothetical protein
MVNVVSDAGMIVVLGVVLVVVGVGEGGVMRRQVLQHLSQRSQKMNERQ